MGFKPVETATASFWTSTPPAEVSTSIQSYIKSTRGKLTNQTPALLEARYGSKFMVRLVGVAMGGKEVFPLSLKVDMVPENNGTRVSITVKDEFGFGSRVWVENQARHLFNQHLVFIRSRFPDAT